jgi:hypothetical protein
MRLENRWRREKDAQQYNNKRDMNENEDNVMMTMMFHSQAERGGGEDRRERG